MRVGVSSPALSQDRLGGDDTAVSESEPGARKELIDVMEARRADSARFTWAVPAVVVASQAFLITIALDGGASPERRLIASAAALLTLLGAAHLFWKQAFAYALYEAVLKRERLLLGLRLVDRDSLLAEADTLEERFQDEWLEKRGGALVRTAGPEGYYQPRWTIRRRALHVWLLLFLMVGVLDVGLGFWAVYDWFAWEWLDWVPDARSNGGP